MSLSVKVFTWTKAALLALLVAGCGSQPARGEGVPALLASANPETHAELQGVISEALHGVSVTLAGDALVNESFLVIERRPVRNLQHPGGLNGRKLEKPERFRLMTDGSSCWLLKLSDNSRWSLPGASCVPERPEEG